MPRSQQSSKRENLICSQRLVASGNFSRRNLFNPPFIDDDPIHGPSNPPFFPRFSYVFPIKSSIVSRGFPRHVAPGASQRRRCGHRLEVCFVLRAHLRSVILITYYTLLYVYHTHIHIYIYMYTYADSHTYTQT